VIFGRNKGRENTMGKVRDTRVHAVFEKIQKGNTGFRSK
jgi:hypothetical protein